jgi:hypothetical protein
MTGEKRARTKMSDVKTTFMRELNDGVGATVDARMVPIIKFLNRLGVRTVSSRFDGEFAEVVFTGGDFRTMTDLLFNHLKAMTDHLEGVHLELNFDSLIGYTGLIDFRAEHLDDVSSRVGVWLELIHK